MLFIVYPEFKFNRTSCILFGNPMLKEIVLFCVVLIMPRGCVLHVFAIM